MLRSLALAPRGSRFEAAYFVALADERRVGSLLLSTAARDPPCRAPASKVIDRWRPSEERGGGDDQPCRVAAGSLGARDRRNRCVSLIADPVGDPIVVGRLERTMSSRGGLRLSRARVRRCSTVRKCDDTQSAAGGDRCADRR